MNHMFYTPGNSGPLDYHWKNEWPFFEINFTNSFVPGWARVLKDWCKYRQAVPAIVDVRPYKRNETWYELDELWSGVLEWRKIRKMIIPNLAAGLPVVLVVYTGGFEERSLLIDTIEIPNAHVIVVDGYGMIGSKRYYHLNMGWAGHDDGWYPLEDGQPYGLAGAIYNIDPHTNSEIICGSVRDQDNEPVEGIEVALYDYAGCRQVSSDTTSAAGIYAFKWIGAYHTYQIRIADKHLDYCLSSTEQEVYIQCRSGDGGDTPGNEWGKDIDVELKEFWIDVRKEGFGTATVTMTGKQPRSAPWTGDVKALSKITLEAEGRGAYSVFDRWTGDLFSTEPTVTFSPDSPKTTTAHFTDTRYQQFLRVEKTGNGRIYVNGQLRTLPCQQQFSYGTRVTLRAESSLLEPLMYWTDGGSKARGSIFVVPMNGPRTITAHFFVPGTGEQGSIVTGFKEWQKDIHPASLLPSEGGGRLWHGETATWCFLATEVAGGSSEPWTSDYVCTSSYGEVCGWTHEPYTYIKFCAGTDGDAEDHGITSKLTLDTECVQAGLRDFHQQQALGSWLIYSSDVTGSGGFPVNIYAGHNGADIYKVSGRLGFIKYVTPEPNPYPIGVQDASMLFTVGVRPSDDYAAVLAETRSINLEEGQCVSISEHDGMMAGRRDDWQSEQVPDYPTGDAIEYVRARFISDLGHEEDVPFSTLLSGKVFIVPEDGRILFYSTFPSSYSDKRGGCLVEVQVCDCPDFEDCGLLVGLNDIPDAANAPIGAAAEFPMCVLFLADSGGYCHLDKLGGFEAGDRVWVQGKIKCTCGDTYCEEIADACIAVTTITSCGGADFAQYERPGAEFYPSPIQAGEVFTLVFGGANDGTVDIAPGWWIRYYASLDTNITSGDYLLYECPPADFGIPAGRQLPLSDVFVFPGSVPSGQYYVGWIFDPDNAVPESNEDNNAGYIKGTRLTVGGGGACNADFCQYQPADEGFYPSSIEAGDDFILDFGVRNCGTESIAAGWRIRYYASVDTTITSGDYFLFEGVAEFGLAPGQQGTAREVFPFPSDVPSGQYYIGWIFDPYNNVCESNESNNAGYIKGTRLTVVGTPAPDSFQGCGQIVNRCLPLGGGLQVCRIVFQTDSGEFYRLDTLGGFDVGDRVYVEGHLDMTVYDSLQDGLITVTTITSCSAN